MKESAYQHDVGNDKEKERNQDQSKNVFNDVPDDEVEHRVVRDTPCLAKLKVRACRERFK